MKIGIIVHSQTGHTESVAIKIKDHLAKKGHLAVIEKITSENAGKINTAGYDALVFGAPVMAFSLSKDMTSFLTQLPMLQDKKIFCFVTKSLPFSWTGGTAAVNSMKKICLSRKGLVCGTGIINWTNSTQREKKIVEIVNKLDVLL
jgi:NAD(P)H dehydrogenase (quinone)